MDKDIGHLRLLAVLHYVMAGLTGLCACFPVIHLALGIAVVSGVLPEPPRGEPIPQAVGWIFIVVGTAFIVLGWSYALGMAVAGRLLQRRRGYLFCTTMAVLSLALVPHGTALGVFTLIVLFRPSVQTLFGRGAKPTSPEWSAE